MKYFCGFADDSLCDLMKMCGYQSKFERLVVAGVIVCTAFYIYNA